MTQTYASVQEIFDSIQARLDAEPLWKKAKRPFIRAKYKYEHNKGWPRRAYQRLTKGYDERDIWSLDSWMARTIGPQLITMSEIAHGWPGEEYQGGFDGWVADLKKNGEALLAYAGRGEGDAPFYDPKVSEDATNAMRWVAEWFTALWD